MSKWAKSLRSVKSEKSVNCEKSLKGVNSGAAVSAVYPARARPKVLRAESARAVTGRRCPHRQWEGGRLFDRSAGFFYGNCCNFGTES